ncbi:MAG: hypothetical protein K2H59_07950 [Muribaculaceae bacterium]|nr:hypothetical protein [Muribaculaceae bacterium]
MIYLALVLVEDHKLRLTQSWLVRALAVTESKPLSTSSTMMNPLPNNFSFYNFVSVITT